jgi:hypothetical protein
MKAIIEKISLTDKENEHLAKGIAIGVGLGVVLGIIIDNITLGFSFGGVIGIVASLGYSFLQKNK